MQPSRQFGWPRRLPDGASRRASWSHRLRRQLGRAGSPSVCLAIAQGQQPPWAAAHDEQPLWAVQNAQHKQPFCRLQNVQ
eukprot:11154609-Lingulodinium_polyedra.AAC.1